jgi:hypothetical protein
MKPAATKGTVPVGQKNGKNDTGPVPPSIPVQAFVVNAVKRLKG